MPSDALINDVIPQQLKYMSLGFGSKIGSSYHQS